MYSNLPYPSPSLSSSSPLLYSTVPSSLGIKSSDSKEYSLLNNSFRQNNETSASVEVRQLSEMTSCSRASYPFQIEKGQNIMKNSPAQGRSSTTSSSLTNITPAMPMPDWLNFPVLLNEKNLDSSLLSDNDLDDQLTARFGLNTLKQLKVHPSREESRAST